MSTTRKSQDKEITKEMVVINKLGVHARPAAMFVKVANRFESEIYVEKDGETVNGKSIMGLMMLAAGPGSKLHVRASGMHYRCSEREIMLPVWRALDLRRSITTPKASEASPARSAM